MMLKLLAVSFIASLIVTFAVFWIINPIQDTGRTFREWVKACPLFGD
jgi:uncharacterized protein HemY